MLLNHPVTERAEDKSPSASISYFLITFLLKDFFTLTNFLPRGEDG